jgi:hypothetical protein
VRYDPRRWILVVTLSSACAGESGSGDTSSSEAGSGEASTGGGPTSSSADSTTADASSGGDASGSSGAGVCEEEQPAIVTDIDETLTTSDAEFFMQLMDPTYDPMEREGGAAMIDAYADLGYRIMYLTARSEDLDVADSDETAREITVRWLEEHGYPLDPTTTVVVLSETLVVGDATQEYKAGALMEQQAMGWRFDYAYGNATTDIGAYAEAGIDTAVTFIIGEHAGEGGTVAIDGEGWVDHTAEHLPTVPAVCEAA